MNTDHAQAQPTTSHQRHSQVDTRLQGRWLLLARVGWGVLVTLTLAICFGSLPVYLALLHTPCAGTACNYQQLSPGQTEALKGMGLSPGAYAMIIVALTLASLAVCLVVSTLLVWRRSSDRMALLVALMLVPFGPIFMTASVVQSASPWQVPNECLTFLTAALIELVFLLFPSGQFVPQWTRWLLVVFLAGQVTDFFPGALLIPNAPASKLGWLVVLGEWVTLAILQFYRYRRVSSPLERQQTKWVVFGLAVPITVNAGATVLALLVPALASPGSLYTPAFVAIQAFLQLLFPLSLGFAMLRYRLFDLDLIIKRTLVYGALIVILTGVYVGLVIGLQALLRGIISQDSSVAIVISTLAIAALFQPLRRRIQQSIDRRFYRSKYDAARTVVAFSATLRNEVDLEQLREQLLAVVQETMQPAHASLWLRPPEPSGKQKPWLLARSDEEKSGEP